MQVPKETHRCRPWRIHAIAGDLRLEDVWELPTPGGPDDFPRLVEQFAKGDPTKHAPGPARVLFALRAGLGDLFGLDGEQTGLGTRVPTLRDRLPADLLAGPAGPAFAALPFTPLYLTHDEFAAEVANRTVHGVLHLGWVPDGSGGYRGEMAVYVKPNGVLGHAYMAAINPFRHLLVYPPMLREMGRRWSSSARGAVPT